MPLIEALCYKWLGFQGQREESSSKKRNIGRHVQVGAAAHQEADPEIDADLAGAYTGREAEADPEIGADLAGAYTGREAVLAAIDTGQNNSRQPTYVDILPDALKHLQVEMHHCT